MARGLSPWRALRPVLLAGAATLTWLTLSSTAATADSADSGSLLGGVTSSVSSLASPLASTLPSRPEVAPPAPQPAAPSGLLQPVVGTLASSTDQLVATVPVVNEVVPAGTVSVVAVPVAVVADDAASGLVETVAPPLVEAVPVLEPVLQPVSDLVTGAAPLPVTLPSVPDSGSVVTGTAGVLDEAPAAAAPSAAGIPTATVSGQLPGAAGEEGSPTPSVALARTSASHDAPTTASGSAEPALPLAGDPYPAPSGPSSGAGSGTSPSGPSGSAAWLNDLDFELLLPGSLPVSGSSEHAPSPVSFDPGSSPD
jgi:hypothetical protein